MDRTQRAKMLLLEIEAVKDCSAHVSDLLILINEVLKDAEALAKDIVSDSQDLETTEQ